MMERSYIPLTIRVRIRMHNSVGTCKSARGNNGGTIITPVRYLSYIMMEAVPTRDGKVVMPVGYESSPTT